MESRWIGQVGCNNVTSVAKGVRSNSCGAQVTEHHITRTFTFPDFRKALGFVNRVGELAEQQGHHPDILRAWGKAEVTLWTHKIDGLTESDFIMAAKIDGVFPR